MISTDHLQTFLLSLRSQGFKIGTVEILRVQQILLAMAAKGGLPENLTKLKNFLAPLVSTTPREQGLFYQNYKEWVSQESPQEIVPGDDDTKSADASLPSSAEMKKLEEQVLAPFQAKWSSMWWVAGVLVILGIILLVTYESQRNENIIQESIPPKVLDGSKPPPIETQVQGLTDSKTPDFSIEGIAVAGVPLLIWGGWKRFRQRRQRELERRLSNQTLDADRVYLKTVPGTPFGSNEFRGYLQSLRLHRKVDSTFIDIPRTITATVKAGGIPTIIFLQRQMVPEYLLLIDWRGRKDLQANVADQLFRQMSHEHIHIERYHFYGDPRMCIPVDKGSKDFLSPAQDLFELSALHAQHRLILFSDGRSLFDPLTGQPKSWIRLFDAWKVRILLTPIPVEHWGHRERRLEEMEFMVLPSRSSGIVLFADYVRTGLGVDRPLIHSAETGSKHGPYPSLLRVDPERWLDSYPPEDDEIELLVRQLRAYLEPQGFDWFSACAVFPMLLPDLTYHLGARLKDSADIPLISEDRLLHMARLPWFREGSLPDWLRRELVNEMSQERLALILDELQSILLSAGTDLKGGMPLDIVSRTGSAWREVLLDLIRRKPENSPLREHIFLSVVRGQKPSKLAVQAPQKFTDLLRRRWDPVVISGAMVAMFLSFWVWETYPPGGYLPQVAAWIRDQVGHIPQTLAWSIIFAIFGATGIGLVDWTLRASREDDKKGLINRRVSWLGLEVPMPDLFLYISAAVGFPLLALLLIVGPAPSIMSSPTSPFSFNSPGHHEARFAYSVCGMLTAVLILRLAFSPKPQEFPFYLSYPGLVTLLCEKRWVMTSLTLFVSIFAAMYLKNLLFPFFHALTELENPPEIGSLFWITKDFARYGLITGLFNFSVIGGIFFTFRRLLKLTSQMVGLIALSGALAAIFSGAFSAFLVGALEDAPQYVSWAIEQSVRYGSVFFFLTVALSRYSIISFRSGFRCALLVTVLVFMSVGISGVFSLRFHALTLIYLGILISVFWILRKHQTLSWWRFVLTLASCSILLTLFNQLRVLFPFRELNFDVVDNFKILLSPSTNAAYPGSLAILWLCASGILFKPFRTGVQTLRDYAGQNVIEQQPTRVFLGGAIGSIWWICSAAIIALVIVFFDTANLRWFWGPPAWVEEGSGVLKKDDSKAIYGVGTVIGVKNEPLAWDVAENRAKAELAKIFRTYTAYLMQDYAASTAAGNFTKSTEEQNVERAIKTFSAVTLNGVRPVDRYKDDENSTYYVLTKLSFEEMKEALQQAQELDAEVREFVRKNAEKAFKKLEQEEAKRPGGL